MNHQQPSRIPVASPQQPSGKRASKKRLLAIALIIVFAGLLFSTAYFWQKYRAAMKNPNTVVEEVQTITEKIRKFMDLPEGETPNLARVSDKEKLQNQPFFQKAQNGDVVLIYIKAKRAILYRPSANRVIDMVPVSESEVPAQNPPAEKSE